MKYQLRAIALAALLLSGALLLSACGGSKKKSSTSSGGGGDATSLLKDTFSAGHSIKSAKLDLSVNVNLKGSNVPAGNIGVKLSGPFDHLNAKTPPKFDINVAASLASRGSFTAGAASDGNAFVIKIKNNAYALPDAFVSQLKQTYGQQSSTSPKTSLSSLGIQPLKLIKNASIAGDQDVGGEPTTHIKADVDGNGILDTIDAVLAKAGTLGVPQTSVLPKSIPSNVRSQILSAIKGASIDVFTGKTDHTLRELDVALDLKDPSGSGSVKEVLLGLKVVLTDVNKPQSVTLPTNTKPFSQLQQQLGGLLGGLGGLGGSSGLGSTGTNGGSTSTGSTTKTQQALQACLAKAAGDQTKTQKCLALVPTG